MTNKFIKKGIFMIVLLAVAVISCEINPVKSDSIQSDEFKKTRLSYPKIVIIDSCEYIEYNLRYDATIIHKGNCNNPIHKHNGGTNE